MITEKTRTTIIEALAAYANRDIEPFERVKFLLETGQLEAAADICLHYDSIAAVTGDKTWLKDRIVDALAKFAHDKDGVSTEGKANAVAELMYHYVVLDATLLTFMQSLLDRGDYWALGVVAPIAAQIAAGNFNLDVYEETYRECLWELYTKETP